MKNNINRIFIVDDHPIVRLGLRQIIGLERDMEVCGEASEVNDAIMRISQEKPNLVIVDISLDSDLSGLDLIKAINERFHGIKTLVMSMYDEPMYVDRAIRAGARGYITKKYAYTTVIDAVRKVIEGGIYLGEVESDKIIQQMYLASHSRSKATIDTLSNRELEVFQMLGNGFDTISIAEKLGLSKNTVQTYKRQIKEKLNISNHNDLVRRATIYIQSN